MGKRPQQNKGKKKGGKRSRVQRDYDEGLDDEVVEQHIPAGPRAARSTQKKVEASIATWERVKEAQFHQQRKARFAKPPPPEKPRGLTKAQRRARRRRELRGPATERAWPTRKQLSAAARARIVGDGDDDEDDASAGEVSEASSSSEEEEEAESDGESSSGEEEEEEAAAPAAEEDEEEEEEEPEEVADADAIGKERARACDAQFGQSLTAQEVAALSERRPAAEYASASIEHVTVSGAPVDWARLDGEERRLGVRFDDEATSSQRVLLRALSTFKDVVRTDIDYARRPPLLSAALAHVLDHVARSRRVMLRHDRSRKKEEEPSSPVKGASRSAPLVPPKPTETYKHLDDVDEEDTRRDQGPTRCRALVLVATRKAALEVCTTLKALSHRSKHASRLEQELGVDEDDPAMQREGPPDWEAVFGGNTDDVCEIGVSVRVDRQDVSVDFFAGTKTKSDLIVATPLALRLAAEEEDRQGVLDRLSSIEVMVMDQADVLLYQNWETVERALRAINGVPSSVDADVQRVRLPFLDAHGAACRQHIVLSSFNDARLRALVDRPLSGQLRNRSGCVRLTGPPPSKGSLARAVSTHIVHTFRGVRCAAPASSLDARVNAFKDKVLPSLLRRRGATIAGARSLIYCGSYPEFLACRAALREQGADFVSIHEYSRDSEVSRGRSRFFHGRAPLLLYSGRAHFYQRYRIRGASNYVFVSPPDHAHFYSELLSFARDDEATGAAPTALCLYTRFDALALARVLGDARARSCLKRDARGVGGDHLFQGAP